MKSPSDRLLRFFFYTACFSVLLGSILFLFHQRTWIAPLAIVTVLSLAIVFIRHPLLKSFSFTVWVLTLVTASMFYPAAFGVWFGFDLKFLIVPLIQIIMFGMGTTLSVTDFARVLKMPWPVFIGLFLQFTIMPFVGFSIASTFGFAPEIAAGIVLVGSCPGGVASNLIAFLAGGDVALSVTMTSCSTLLSPVMTPFMMKMLAGKLIPIDFMEMMLSILNMIVVPVVAGLIAHRILYSKSPRMKKASYLLGIFFVCGVAAFLIALNGKTWFGSLTPLRDGTMLGFALIAVISVVKWWVSIVMHKENNWMDKVLPLVSMASICFIIAIITARSRDQLLVVGLLLILASIFHNLVGYLLGYVLSRMFRLDEKTCRTIAIEVGMQNAGMGTGLAMSVLKSADAALAPAIFGPWMNVSGSVLANFWQRKTLDSKSKPYDSSSEGKI